MTNIQPLSIHTNSTRHNRHSKAITRLQTWYKEGVDIQTRLPHLATYMGHTQYTHTAYYLTATPELLDLAAERYQNNFGKLEIPE